MNLHKSHKRIELGKLKLNILLEVTKGINNNLSKKELTDIYKNVLIDELLIGKLLLYTINDGVWSQELCIGTSRNNIKVENDLLHYQDIKLLVNPDNEKLSPFDVIIPVFHKSKPLSYLMLGDFDGEKIEVSPIIKHLTFIQTLTNLIVVAIENKRLFKDNLKQVAIKKEMEFASEMQNMLLPQTLPNNNHIEVSAKYIPHHLVGGDYYDFIRLNEYEVAFCIADVSGKGVPAALLMSNFQASLRALVGRTDYLSELISELNIKIINSANKEKFITAFIGKYNCKTRELNYINAGHNPPLLLIENKFKILTEGCTLLGIFKDIPTIVEQKITIPEKSMLFCYTDGITEQTNKNGIEYGEEQLKNAIFLNQKKDIKEINDYIFNELQEFNSLKNYLDDMALLSFRFK